jgi:hypothetical protein
MADESVLYDSLMPANQMRLVQNMDADALGALKGRNGYSRLGSAQVVADNVGLGAIHHIGTNSQIVAFIDEADDSNAEAYYLSGSTWTNKALSFTAGVKVRAISFLDYLIAVNGTDSPKSWSGSAGASWGTTLLSSAPTSGLIGLFKQQVFMGNQTTDQVDFSSIPTGGSITWPADNNFLVSPSDGSHLTAFLTYGKEFLIAKKKYIYRFNGRSIDPDPVIRYGIASQEAVVVCAGVAWFYDSVNDCIAGYSGGFPTIISKPIRSFLKAIPTSSRGLVALRGDDDHVEAFIGNVTVGGVAFVNVSLRYIISTQAWVIRSYAHSFRVFTPYDDGTTQYSLGFTTEGSVVKMDTGNLDLTADIKYDLETAWLTIGNNPSVLTRLAAFAAYMDNGRNISAFVKTDLDQTWRPIGQTKQYVSSFAGINKDFHRVKFRFTGTSSGDPAIFDGFSILIPLLEGVDTTLNE